MANRSPEDKLIKARIDFIYNDCVFLGNLALRLKLVDATKWCPTAATDFKHLYYNRDFIDRCSLDEVKFVIAHEVMHCVYDHFTRREQRDPRLYNCAGDYMINLELKDLNIGSFPSSDTMMDPEWAKKCQEFDPKAWRRYKKEFAGKPGVLCEEKYRDKSSEEIYDLLKKDQDEQDKQNGQGEGDGQCGSCGGSGESQDPADQKGDGSPGDCKDCDGSGKSEGGRGGPVSHDMHIDPKGGDGDDDENDGSEGPIQIDQDEIERMDSDMRKAIMDAAAVAGEARGGAGSIPGGVKRMIEDWVDSTVDWREYLNNTIQSTVKSDYTWQRQSRKSLSTNYYLPAMDNDQMVSVDLAIDTSGSMTEEMLRDILGEVKGIMEQFADFKLRVWCFDTQTYAISEFGPDTVEEIHDFQLVGGGGTMFECNWEMMREEEIVPDQFILCTDGYPCGTWGEEDYCDTVFLVHGRKSIVAPFGVTVHHENATDD